MASGLSTLAENLNPYQINKNEDPYKAKFNKVIRELKEVSNIDELRKVYKNTSDHFKDDEQFLLMIKKGIFPYDYIDDYERLNENKLPTKDNFFLN